MQEMEAALENRTQQTLRLITLGRLTQVPHIVELRYANLDGSFYVLAGSSKSDWLLNALATGHAKVKLGESIFLMRTAPSSYLEKTRVLESFRRKYGVKILDQWYVNTSSCLRLSPVGLANIRGAVRGETQTILRLDEWSRQAKGYTASIQEAFDSASEEYDFTISRNYINTWIRKRSIDELTRIATSDDVLVEIGCGTGAEAIRISKRVRGIIATDISKGMLAILEKKVKARRLDRKILTAEVRASEIATVKDLLPEGHTRIAYSFNGALNCEQNIPRVAEQLHELMARDGYFLCSVRNTLCLSEAISHSLAGQFDKVASRKKQPMMVSVGGMDIPSYYYSPSRFAELFRPYFKLERTIGLPAFLPPAYLNEYYLRAGKVKTILEKMEAVLGQYFPFNRFGDQTLFLFRRV